MEQKKTELIKTLDNQVVQIMADMFDRTSIPMVSALFHSCLLAKTYEIKEKTEDLSLFSEAIVMTYDSGHLDLLSCYGFDNVKNKSELVKKIAFMYS